MDPSGQLREVRTPDAPGQLRRYVLQYFYILQFVQFTFCQVNKQSALHIHLSYMS